MKQCKRNHPNPITLTGENTTNVAQFSDLGKSQNILIFWHVFDSFSQQVGLIELIPFALGQASPDTSTHNIVFQQP
jgi:hypothetical protein